MTSHEKHQKNIVSMTDIEQFYHVLHAAKQYPEFFPSSVTYRAKTKLHGTNTSIVVDPITKTLVVQGRNSQLTESADPYGFYQFCQKHKDWLFSLKEIPFTLFGEWAGPKIQKKDAVTKIPEKTFFCFFAYLQKSPDSRIVLSEPDDLDALTQNKPDRFKVLPWMTDPITVQLYNQKSLTPLIEEGNRLTQEIGVEDPYILKTYGISGPGEGYVYYPVGVQESSLFKKLLYKAKTEHHKVNHTKESVQISPEDIQTLKDFADTFATIQRFEQGYTVLFPQGFASLKDIGDFLKWVCLDVEKESTLERENCHLPWKSLNKAVTKKASEWFLNKIKS